MPKNAIVLMGLPLAGKTTWIEEQKFKNHQYISADDLKEAHPDYDPDTAHLLHLWSVKEAEGRVYLCIDRGYDIVFDSGSINNNYTKRILKALCDAGYFIKLVHIKTPYKVCLERNKIRERKVPESDILSKAVKENKQFHSIRGLVDEVKVVEYFTHKHIFVDMDGVIASLSTLPVVDGCIDFVNGEIHKNLAPVRQVLDKLADIETGSNCEGMYILSATPNSFSTKEKNDWLDEHFPIPQDKRFFVNQGRHKAEMLENLQVRLGLDKKDVTLIDDLHATLYKVEERGMRPMHPSEFLTYKFY